MLHEVWLMLSSPSMHTMQADDNGILNFEDIGTTLLACQGKMQPVCCMQCE